MAFSGIENKAGTEDGSDTWLYRFIYEVTVSGLSETSLRVFF